LDNRRSIKWRRKNGDKVHKTKIRNKREEERVKKSGKLRAKSAVYTFTATYSNLPGVFLCKAPKVK
jgi:hypothetical protein